MIYKVIVCQLFSLRLIYIPNGNLYILNLDNKIYLMHKNNNYCKKRNKYPATMYKRGNNFGTPTDIAMKISQICEIMAREKNVIKTIDLSDNSLQILFNTLLREGIVQI